MYNTPRHFLSALLIVAPPSLGLSGDVGGFRIQKRLFQGPEGALTFPRLFVRGTETKEKVAALE